MNELALIEKNLSTNEGIELSNISDIQVTHNKLFVYKDFHVLVYIRDQYVTKRGRLFEYKFHLCSCKTIEEMMKANRFARYVVSTRNDGMFVVRSYNINTKDNIRNEKIVKMNVCKNCLMELNYNGYCHHKDKKIYESFRIDEFFKKYSSQFKKKPQYTDSDAPPNEYSKDFEQKSYAVRDNNHWECSKCYTNLRNDKNLLDTHHINGVKSDDSWGNLQSLCIRCHSEQPFHERLRHDKRFKQFMMQYGPPNGK